MSDEVIQMEARLENYISGELKKLGYDLLTAQKEIEKTNQAVKRKEESLRSLGAATRQLAGVFGIAFGTQQVVRFFTSAVKGAEEQRQAETRLTTALGFRSEALVDLASQMQRSTMYGDEQIIQAEALLANYVKNEQQLKQLTPAVLDFATATGQDLHSAAAMVARSIADDSAEMGRYRIAIEGAAGSGERVKSTIAGLSTAFGGQARAAAEASNGTVQIGNMFGEIAEGVGNQLQPEISDLTQTVLSASGAFDTLGNTIGAVVLGPFRYATAGIIGISQGMIDIRILGQKLLSITQNEKGKESIRREIADLERMKSALDDQLVEMAKAQFNIKTLSSSDLTIKTGRQNVRGNEKKNKDEEERKAELAAVKKWQEDYLNEMSLRAQRQYEMRQQEKDQIRQHFEEVDVLMEKSFQYEQKLSTERVRLAQEEAAAKQAAGMRIAQDWAASLVRVGQASKANASLMKRLAQFQSVIDTYAMATASYKAMAGIPYVGPALGAAAAAAAIVAGMANVAMIEQQKFAAGGIVGGSLFSGDRIQAGVNSGEMILTREQQGALFSMISGGKRRGSAGSSFSIVINTGGGPVDNSAVSRLEESLVRKLGPALLQAEYEGRLEDFKRVVSR